MVIYLILKVGALTVRMRNGTINPWDGELTFIGKVIGQLPIDVHLGKLLVLSYVFGCLEECLVISKYLFQNFKPYFFSVFRWIITAHLHNFCCFLIRLKVLLYLCGPFLQIPTKENLKPTGTVCTCT